MAEVVVLGLVQGLSEFLPISSSGHLLLARWWLGVSDVAGTATDAFLHVGTLVAVLAYFWRTWWRLLRALGQREAVMDRALLGHVIVATVPAAVVGYAVQGEVADAWRTPPFLAAAFGVTALVLALSEVMPIRWAGWYQRFEVVPLTWPGALVVGMAQVVALAPGVSRAGVTMAAGRLLNMTRAKAAEFSFLMSAPIIAGAGVVSAPEALAAAAGSWWPLMVGVVVAAISGMAAIHTVMRVVSQRSFWPFVVYLAGVAGVMLLWSGR